MPQATTTRCIAPPSTTDQGRALWTSQVQWLEDMHIKRVQLTKELKLYRSIIFPDDLKKNKVANESHMSVSNKDSATDCDATQGSINRWFLHHTTGSYPCGQQRARAAGSSCTSVEIE